MGEVDTLLSSRRIGSDTYEARTNLIQAVLPILQTTTPIELKVGARFVFVTPDSEDLLDLLNI